MAGAVDLSALRARADARSAADRAGRADQADRASPSSAPGAGPWVIDVTEQTFQAEVLERSLEVPVVVDLWAPWCQPCTQLSPVLERLAEQAGGTWVLAKVDIDAHPRIAQAFGVQSIPMVIVLAGGQPVDGFGGVLPESQIRQWIERLLDELRDRMPGIGGAEGTEGTEAAGSAAPDEPTGPPEDPRFTAAEDALERGDYPAAEAAYQAILDAEPANEQAGAAIAQVRFLARAESVDPTAVTRADAHPEDVDAQLAAADAELAAERAEAAFARLVATVGRTDGEQRDRVREHLIGLFELFAPADSRVIAARRALARALF